MERGKEDQGGKEGRRGRRGREEGRGGEAAGAQVSPEWEEHRLT